MSPEQILDDIRSAFVGHLTSAHGMPSTALDDLNIAELHDAHELDHDSPLWLGGPHHPAA